MFNKDKYNALPEKLRAIIAGAVDAASAEMSWKAIDRYSKDYSEMQSKDNVKFYKTPDAILKRQLEVFDEVAKKKAGENPLFKEIVESQLAYAKRVTQWEQDTVVSRRMAYNHYFGPNAKKKT
jgi:TRAP-type mannitol/chloroaromatic compound transport system substrate-binding protein